MSSVTTDSQNSVFAKITPAPEKLDSNNVATDSSHDTGAGNDNPQGITPSEKKMGPQKKSLLIRPILMTLTAGRQQLNKTMMKQ